MIALSAFRFTPRSPRVTQLLQSLSRRLYTTQPPPGARPTLRPAASTVKGASHQLQSLQNKRAFAERIWREGRHEIFKAPSHTGLIAGAWIIAASCFLCVNYYSRSGMLDIQEMGKRGLNKLVPITYTGVAIFISIAGGLCLSRTFWFVKSIRLIQNEGKTMIEILQRPVLPTTTRRFVVEPGKLSMQRKVAYVAENPFSSKTAVGQQATAAAAVGGVLKNIVLTPYLVVRKLFTHESVVTAHVMVKNRKGQETKRLLRIDADGALSNGGKDLVDLATFED